MKHTVTIRRISRFHWAWQDTKSTVGGSALTRQGALADAKRKLDAHTRRETKRAARIKAINDSREEIEI